MADEGDSPSCLPLPESPRDSTSYHQDLFLAAGDDTLEGCGPSSVEVQLDLSDSSRSISLESRLDDFNDCNSPLQTVASDTEQDLDIMGIANTWNEDDAFASTAAPSDRLDTSLLVAPRPLTNYGPRPSPSSLDMFGDEQEPDCEPISDVKDINSCAGVCGLRNMGNTCFMNAGLQCLVSTTPLVNYFLVHPVDERQLGHEGGSSLTFHFAAMLLKMWSGHYSTLAPTEFKQALASCHSQFKDYRQHDCQEFLALMLDTLHEQLKMLQLKPSSSHFNQTVREERAADIAPDCCLHAISGEPVELYESSRSSQLSSPRSSDSAETSSSCTTNYSSAAAAAAALSLRSLPIPEEVKEFSSNYGTAELLEDFTENKQSQQMVLHRNILDLNHDNSPVLEKNVLTEISSMIKDSKTANVNLMTSSASDAPANNELHFDSNKFPRFEYLKTRPGNPISPTVLRNSLDKVPHKVTNFLREAAKRNSDREDQPCSSNSVHCSEDLSNKKPRVDVSSNETVWRMMSSMQTKDSSPDCGTSSCCGNDVPVKIEEQCTTLVSSKSSVVTESFQGVFRSTVVCSSCSHVSVTYEPFMYLSLPLPHALERSLELIVVPEGRRIKPYRLSVVVNQYDKVVKLRQLVDKELKLTTEESARWILAEVSDHYVVRILEDHFPIRSLKEKQRSVYAFQVPTPQILPPTEESQPNWKLSRDQENSSWKTCVICLDEKSDSELFKHTSCPCLLCRPCIELSCRHQGRDGQTLLCPVCYIQVKHEEEFAPLVRIHEYRPVVRILKVPIVFRRNDGIDDGRCIRLTGIPRIVELPSYLPGSAIYNVLQDLVPGGVELNIHLVDVKGLRCSRCVYPTKCTGCLVQKEEQINLQPADCLAVQVDVIKESAANSLFDECIVDVEEYPSDKKLRSEVLTLSDCLRAFSDSELLDEGNPWFCPSCQKNQCASKTLSIQQPPPFIIVYLKRFVFHENASVKLDNRVSFPVNGLNLGPYLSSSIDTHGAIYNLYAIVCHFGSASSGHYTCYSKHFTTGDWHYFNDETVLKRSPQEEDYRHAYILFYQRNPRQTSLNAAK